MWRLGKDQRTKLIINHLESMEMFKKMWAGNLYRIGIVFLGK